MTALGSQLSLLYLRLTSGVLLGWLLGRFLPKTVPTTLGQFLFWIGVPVGVVAFLRDAKLSGALWLAPAIAWVAIALGAALAWLWMRIRTRVKPADPLARDRPFQGSFLLASMVGNTGYLGYPIVLSLVGEKYFAWAIFYDLLGTLLGAYGLGVILAARLGNKSDRAPNWLLPIFKNPTLWCLGFGLWFRRVWLPVPAERALQTFAWTGVALSLVLIGMRLSQIHSWKNWQPASVSLGIKMLVVPFAIAGLLSPMDITRATQLVLVLQTAMPPAFATLVIAEAYDLDRDLAVTTLAMGSTGLLLTLPMWVLLFQP
jgi:malate permease and related proteins